MSFKIVENCVVSLQTRCKTFDMQYDIFIDHKQLNQQNIQKLKTITGQNLMTEKYI